MRRRGGAKIETCTGTHELDVDVKQREEYDT
jgi:hypothetical protein